MAENETDPAPEWGKMSRGQPYVNLATDVFRALFALGLGEIEGSVLAHVIENTWGRTARRGRKGTLWPDPEPCKLDRPSLCREFDVKKQNLKRTIDRLVESRMIVKVDGGYLFNKNAHQWVKPGSGEALLRRKMLDHAVKAQRLKVIVADDFRPEPKVIVADDRSRKKVIVADDPKTTPVISCDDRKSPEVIVADDFSHYIEPARKLSEGNTNPTGSHSNAGGREDGALRSRKKAPRNAHKQRPLRLSDDDGHEPFTSPASEPPPPIVLSPDEANLKAATERAVLKATTSELMPQGNPDAADALADWAIDHFRRGALKHAIRDSIGKTCSMLSKGGRWGSSLSYAEACLVGWSAKTASRGEGDAWKPSQASVNAPRTIGGVSETNLSIAATKRGDEAIRGLLDDWDSAPESTRLAVGAEYDLANPRPEGIHPRLWEAARRRGCAELLASRSAKPPLSP